MIVVLIMSLGAFFEWSFRYPLKKLAASLLTKKLVHNNLVISFQLLAVQVEQTNKNGKFAFFVYCINCDSI